ncbi:integrase catalytic domain-containing protein [Nephila pilipes]|uniref:Integrase catalytic domain-containing protein n=1 Tax=Nephila pilipes TaxID=299642 RepID=A0A8X6QT25_NEPPI|nr:integrase catalytic domain-containing protein [Nephila pilipes]
MATDENINKLQRKRSTLRSKVTRLTGKLNNEDGIDKAFDVELLEDTLQDLKLMNETIHDLLNDEDYEWDTVDCEKYFDTAKLAIFHTKRKVSANINVSSEFSPPSSINTSVKLPTIKINTFFGGIEEFPSFWERFNSCIDSNASLSLVDKHVFLRGYLDGEAKRLVDGISVIGDTYETTKKLLEDKYDEIAVYRFSRLPFGLTCSPFLLCASTRELAMKHVSEFPIAASMIDKHLYMDDFLASTETETHITMLYHEIKDLMTLMKLPMEKWATNSLKLNDVIQTNKEFHKSTTAILGIDWDTNDDTLGNAFKTSFCVAGGKPLTKRWLLRCIASCYDPLGLFSPFTIIGKILFQDTWILGIKWDELLPTNLSTMWYAAVKQLDDICSIKISRYIGISSHTPYSVHVFCDASERAYGSVLYIVTSQSNVHIVCSRNRLAPIKKVTLPRLELLAALMGTRLLKYFCKEVDIQPSAATLWTDSQNTLSWIRSNPNKWKTFVCTRTTEILQYTRALHLELVSDLSTDKFLLALQRFVGRRGLPCTIYTDNATTFHAANKELIHLWKVITSGKIQQFYAHNGIHWKFIVPRAAW